MSNFIEKCILRQANPENIDDFIEQWHKQPGNQALHEFLGMTRDEYAGWIADSARLAAIIHSRQSGLQGGAGN
nr:hypothetical protein [uncultured Duganella sp.]